MLGGPLLIVMVGEDPLGSLRATVVVRALLQLNVVVGENVEVDPESVRAPLLVCSESYFVLGRQLLLVGKTLSLYTHEFSHWETQSTIIISRYYYTFQLCL